MTDQKDSTEQKIIDAAHEVFLKKGLDGSRMQEIANMAGINKALLHYYFRSKQKLFEAIFKNIIAHAFPDIRSIIMADLPVEEKIRGFVEKYIDMMAKNPYIPAFILKEINRDPEFIAGVIRSQGINPADILSMLEKEMAAGTIRKMNPREIMVNLIGLVIFPFAAAPMLNIILFNSNKKAYREFLNDRKITVTEFILNAILIR